ncbi:cellulose biosynthesis cyclic di-GMP-binding regulatory protein BcsB, partial [Pseudomonas syringae pv. tagetis]
CVMEAALIASAADMEFLFMSSGSDLALVNHWAERLPTSGNGQQQGFEPSDLSFRLREWMSPDPDDNQRRARVGMAFSS